MHAFESGFAAMPRLLLPIALSVSALLCTPAHASMLPADVVSGFYMARLSGGEAGTPNGFQLARYSSYLSPKLVCMLGNSLRYQEHFAREHPGEASPFPADLYSGRNMIPASFTLDKFEQSGAHATATVSLMTRPNEDQPPIVWSNTLKLEIVRNHWLISDIDYGGEQSASLMSMLDEVLHKAPAVDGWSIKELESCVIDKVPAKSHRTSKSKHSRHSTKAAGHTKAKTSSKKTSSHAVKHASSAKKAKTQSSKSAKTAKAKTHTKKK